MRPTRLYAIGIVLLVAITSLYLSDFRLGRTGTPDGKEPDSLLMRSIITGDVGAARRYLGNYPAGSFRLDHLSTAAARGNVDIVRLLLDHGFSPDGVLHDGSPLLCAVSRRFPDVAEALLNHGANPDLHTNFNSTALMCVSGDYAFDQSTRLKIAAELIRCGANVDRGANPQSWAEPDRSERNKLTANTRRAVSSGRAINVPTSSVNLPPPDTSPLHAAVRSGSVRVVDLLLSRGADVTIRSKSGETPLAMAIRLRHPELARRLAAIGPHR